MSTNETEALFVINDNNDSYEEDPAVIRARENLVLAEKVQQEWVKQQWLERAQRQAEVKVESVRYHISYY